LINQFMKRYSIEGASKGEIEGGAVFGGREFGV
jgi:hypothetical protein